MMPGVNETEVKNDIRRQIIRINAIALSVNRPDQHNAMTPDEVAIALKDIARNLEASLTNFD